MCPTVVVGEGGEAVLVIGASGGTRITTAVAQVGLVEGDVGNLAQAELFTNMCNSMKKK